MAATAGATAAAIDQLVEMSLDDIIKVQVRVTAAHPVVPT